MTSLPERLKSIINKTPIYNPRHRAQEFLGRFQKRPTRERARRPPRGVKLRITTTSHGTKFDRSLFFICERFVDAHNVDRGVLVSVHETVTSIADSIFTSQYTVNLLSLLQNYVFIQSFENAGEDFLTTLAATL